MAEMGGLLMVVVPVSLVFCSISAETVPVLMWGKGSDSSNFPAVSALSVIPRDTFIKQFLEELVVQKNPLIVQFLQDELSPETFSVTGREENKDGESTVFKNVDAALNTHAFLYLSIEDAAGAIRSWAKQYRTKEVRPDDGPDAIILAAQQADILTVRLPDTATAIDKREALRNSDAIIGATMKIIENKRNDVVFLFTGMKPAWEQEEPNQHLSRRLLATADSSNNCTLLNISSGEILLCTNNVTFTYTDAETKEVNVTEWEPNELTTDKSTASNSSSTIVLVFPPNNWVSSLLLTMDFNQSAGSWSVVSATADFVMKPNKAEISGSANMTPADIGAAQGFSYSCSKTVLQGYFDNDTIAVTFDFFQVQAFGIRDSRFSDSFDCSTFFTIPIWMGLFVVILFTAILAIGIYMLFEVHTMDRFDDPKGKPLVITTSD